jgi:hypothetical protein
MSSLNSPRFSVFRGKTSRAMANSSTWTLDGNESPAFLEPAGGGARERTHSRGRLVPVLIDGAAPAVPAVCLFEVPVAQLSIGSGSCALVAALGFS